MEKHSFVLTEIPEFDTILFASRALKVGRAIEQVRVVFDE